PAALSQKLMPSESFFLNQIELKTGQRYPREELLTSLVRLGYSRVDMVEEKGEFAVRGEIIDIYALGATNPLRLDFFDEELESVNTFEVETQRSLKPLESFCVLPASEALLGTVNTHMALKRLSGLKANTQPETYFEIRENIESGIGFSGIENLMPIFYSKTENLFDYFRQAPLILALEPESLKKHQELFFEEVCHEYEYSIKEGSPTVAPDDLYLSPKELTGLLKKHPRIYLFRDASGEKQAINLPIRDNSLLRQIDVFGDSPVQNPTRSILEQLKRWHLTGAKVIVTAGSYTRAEHIRQTLEEFGISVPISEKSGEEIINGLFLTPSQPMDLSFCLLVSKLSRGFKWLNSQCEVEALLVSEEEIFGPKQKQRTLKKSKIQHFFSSIGDLKVKDYVVHVEYGIGSYQGLKKIQTGDQQTDFLVIQYQGGDKVYVPVDKFHLVQKYAGGDAQAPNLNRLGDKSWSKTKTKIRSEIDDIADELVRLYAERKACRAIAFSPESSLTRDFALNFSYQETDDQEKAIQEVTSDMESEMPMDRLVCGDVGFGKTEVAMRAAYKAVVDGYQIGFLAPTTVLAQQHYETFKKRFENTAVSIGLLSRFKTPTQIKQTLKDLKENKVDIVIGTHRLLSKDVVFNKLGLLVIDEEQRFGVRHKETIKKIKTNVDTLALSATPIPRTLHMSLIGIRDISIINTPPMDRRAIRTRLLKLSDYVITEAVNREIRRKGQVFFVHNRVESIHEVGQYLKHILPNIRIAIAHGQMSERDLEEVMRGFIQREFDLLLCTTIIESGLDIPNTNTILINNADKFGLSQLYQLRGRVGRSSVQAYAYLLTPKEKTLTDLARKRLNILQELNHLGAGFKIANFDLELRGAGNLLGSKQSGHITQVGFELYTQMIEEAVSSISNQEVKKQSQACEVKLNLGLDASLPDHFISSMNHRLDAYRQIAAAKSDEELWETRASLEDRYGKLPDQALGLFESMEIKLLAASLDIEQIDVFGDVFLIRFSDKFKPDPKVLFPFVENSPVPLRILPDNKIQLQPVKTSTFELKYFLKGLDKAISSGELATTQ
ncbi:MAG: transcription-repair coupling factor, partial [Deltaproteobacteria bacterium]|nr:transcription-repair coupling factor [Deltaproteobacteria bacterium]